SQSGWQKDQKIWARIVAPGYVAQPVTPEILTGPADLKKLVVRMKKGAKLNGVVLDYQKKPVEGANIYLVTTGVSLENGAPDPISGRSFSGTSAKTDREGKYSIAGVDPSAGQRLAIWGKDMPGLVMPLEQAMKMPTIT